MLLAYDIMIFLLTVIKTREGWLKYRASNRLDILSIIKTVEENSPLCPQSSPLSPDAHGDLFNSLESLYSTDSCKLHAYESLGGAGRSP